MIYTIMRFFKQRKPIPQAITYVLYSINVALCVLFLMRDVVFLSLTFEVLFWFVFLIINSITICGLLLMKNHMDTLLLTVLPIIYFLDFFAERLMFVFLILFAVVTYLMFLKKQHVVARIICCCTGAMLLFVCVIAAIMPPIPVEQAYHPNPNGNYSVVITLADLGATGYGRAVKIRQTIIPNQLYLDKSLSTVGFSDVGLDTEVVWLDNRTFLIGKHTVRF